MKNKIIIVLIACFSLGLTSCKKEDAHKDVDGLIKKMNYFCKKYEEFSADGVISKEAKSKKDESEYVQLKKIAQGYYEAMNKINKNVQKEQEKLEKGKNPKKLKGYGESYQSALKEKNAEIEEATKKFNEALNEVKKLKE